MYNPAIVFSGPDNHLLSIRELDLLSSSDSLWWNRVENYTPCQWPDTLVRGQLKAERIEDNEVSEVKLEGQDGHCSLGS